MSRSAFVRISFALIALLTAARDASSATPITACGQFFHGRGVLMGDLDCSAFDGHGVILTSGKLDLAGFTIFQGHGYAVGCFGNCRITGPGKIVGSANGFEAVRAESVSVHNVDISGSNGAVNASNSGGSGRAMIRDSTISGNQFGVTADRLVKLVRSTVTANRTNGATTGETHCVPGKIVAIDSTITGNGTDPSCGIMFTCADVATCERMPILRRSTCGTSYMLDSGVPGESLGVCTLD